MRVSELQLHITLVVLGNVMLCEKNKSQKIQQHANLYIRFKTQPRCTICKVGIQTWKNYSEEQDLNTELGTVRRGGAWHEGYGNLRRNVLCSLHYYCLCPL